MRTESIAFATEIQVANALVAPATVRHMEEREIQARRIARLAAMVEREGGKAPAGRKLGYRDGAFVGQMLRGERPITEKTVMAVHALSGYSGWMDQQPVHANTSPGPDLRGKVPLISWIQAGEWCQAADPLLPGQAERWMDCPVSHSSSTFALRVRGDSMTAPHGNSRTYPEGCYIFVDPEKRTPTNGDRVVACLTGTDEVTFKVYKNEDGRQWLQPLNPSHEPIRESFHILGTVLGKWEDG